MRAPKTLTRAVLPLAALLLPLLLGAVLLLQPSGLAPHATGHPRAAKDVSGAAGAAAWVPPTKPSSRLEALRPHALLVGERAWLRTRSLAAPYELSSPVILVADVFLQGRCLGVVSIVDPDPTLAGLQDLRRLHLRVHASGSIGAQTLTLDDSVVKHFSHAGAYNTAKGWVCRDELRSVDELNVTLAFSHLRESRTVRVVRDFGGEGASFPAALPSAKAAGLCPDFDLTTGTASYDASGLIRQRASPLPLRLAMFTVLRYDLHLAPAWLDAKRALGFSAFYIVFNGNVDALPATHFRILLALAREPDVVVIQLPFTYWGRLAVAVPWQQYQGQFAAIGIVTSRFSPCHDVIVHMDVDEWLVMPEVSEARAAGRSYGDAGWVYSSSGSSDKQLFFVPPALQRAEMTKWPLLDLMASTCIGRPCSFSMFWLAIRPNAIPPRDAAFTAREAIALPLLTLEAAMDFPWRRVKNGYPVHAGGRTSTDPRTKLRVPAVHNSGPDTWAATHYFETKTVHFLHMLNSRNHVSAVGSSSSDGDTMARDMWAGVYKHKRAGRFQVRNETGIADVLVAAGGVSPLRHS